MRVGDVTFLKLVPDDSEGTNAEWRKLVRQKHEETSAKKALTKNIGVGDTVILKDGCSPKEFTVHSVRPLLGYASSGLLYRVPRSKIIEVRKVEAKSP